MSLIGIFRAKNGITALVDSKATENLADGTVEEMIGRNPEKLYPFEGGVLVVCGALQIYTGHKSTSQSEKLPVESMIRGYLSRHKTIDSAFFQDVLLKMNSSPLNKEPIRFILGRKIWTGRYRIEYHKVGYDYYAMKIGAGEECCFVTGSDVYVDAFKQLDYKSMKDSVETLQQYTAGKLQEMIDFYDRTLAYNPVGGLVKSYILK